MNLSLWELGAKMVGVVCGFTEELPVTLRGRLCELGFDSGQSVTCLRVTPFGGPRIYRINDGVFSLECDIARRILIQARE